jgi:hypothetical protein
MFITSFLSHNEDQAVGLDSSVVKASRPDWPRGQTGLEARLASRPKDVASASSFLASASRIWPRHTRPDARGQEIFFSIWRKVTRRVLTDYWLSIQFFLGIAIPGQFPNPGIQDWR